MPPASEVDSIKLYIAGASNPALRLSLNDITGAGDKVLTLVDKYANTKTIITNENNGYVLGIDRNNVNTFGQNRLVLLLSPKSVSAIEERNFKAELQNNGVLLTWQTVSETNSRFIFIERSEDGKSFVTMGTKEGAGNSRNVIDYNFLDKNPVDGTLYYRLRSVDINGAETYGIIKSVNYSLKANGDFSLYPNPAKNEINISWKSDDEVSIKIFDIAGKQVESFDNVKSNSYKANLGGLVTGTYIIKLQGKKSQSPIAVGKFVKD